MVIHERMWHPPLHDDRKTLIVGNDAHIVPQIATIHKNGSMWASTPTRLGQQDIRRAEVVTPYKLNLIL